MATGRSVRAREMKRRALSTGLGCAFPPAPRLAISGVNGDSHVTVGALDGAEAQQLPDYARLCETMRVSWTKKSLLVDTRESRSRIRNA